MRAGIAAVTARLENGTLRIVQGRCPNLLSEAELYRYDDTSGRRTESPLSEHNHALDALRYLIATLDERRLSRPRASPESQPRRNRSRKASSEFWHAFWNDPNVWTLFPMTQRTKNHE